MSDHCTSCGSHDVEVTIDIREEQEGSPFSREPYREVNCNKCGETREQRMNNA